MIFKVIMQNKVSCCVTIMDKVKAKNGRMGSGVTFPPLNKIVCAHVLGCLRGFCCTQATYQSVQIINMFAYCRFKPSMFLQWELSDGVKHQCCCYGYLHFNILCAVIEVSWCRIYKHQRQVYQTAMVWWIYRSLHASLIMNLFIH